MLFLCYALKNIFSGWLYSTHNLDNKDARLYHLEGVIRTQAILLNEGKIKS